MICFYRATGSAVSGYDITNKSGLITLLNNREITTTSFKEDVWTVTITFINYDANQADNTGKSMSAKVMIQKGILELDKLINIMLLFIKTLNYMIQNIKQILLILLLLLLLKTPNSRIDINN